MNDRYLRLKPPCRRQNEGEIRAIVDSIESMNSDDECLTVWQ